MRKVDYFKEIENKFYTPENLSVAEAFFDSVLSTLRQVPHQVLEVGCGYGLAASYFVKTVKRLRLFDVDRSALEFVGWKYGNKVDLCSELCYDPSDVMIYFFLSLHHIPNFLKILDGALAHIVRYGGIVAVCEFEPSDEYIFHQKESSPHDGLNIGEFDWIKESFPQLDLSFSYLPSLNVHDHSFQCYSLIIQNKV